MTKVRIACVLLAALILSALAYGAPVRLRCESLQNPLGIDSSKPRLSWQSDNTERNWRQSAYQILVAVSPESLKSAHPDIWDSGKVSSGESVGIAYGGPQLQSRKRYYWTVRVWDAAGKAAAAAEAACGRARGDEELNLIACGMEYLRRGFQWRASGFPRTSSETIRNRDGHLHARD